jgi:hypothetical protein
VLDDGHDGFSEATGTVNVSKMQPDSEMRRQQLPARPMVVTS